MRIPYFGDAGIQVIDDDKGAVLWTGVYFSAWRRLAQ